MTTPEVGERRQDGEPRPDDDVDLARPDPTPLVGALAVAEAGVDERDPRLEVRAQPVDERQRQRDLRHEDEGPPAGLEGLRDRLDVDRRLAAAGHAVEEERRRVAARPSPPAIDRERLGLRRQEVRRRRAAAAPPGRSTGEGAARPLADLGARRGRAGRSPATADVPCRRAQVRPRTSPSGASRPARGSRRRAGRGPSGRPLEPGARPDALAAAAACPSGVSRIHRS